VVSLTDVPASDFTREEKIPESVRSTDSQILDSVVSVAELEKLRREMKMMEAALQGAARQSQVSFPHAQISVVAIQLKLVELYSMKGTPHGSEPFKSVNSYFFVENKGSILVILYSSCFIIVAWTLVQLKHLIGPGPMCHLVATYPSL